MITVAATSLTRFFLQEFEDLDEIIARHIQPMASFVREILNHKYFRAADGGQKSKMEEILLAEKKRTPQRIPYFLSTSKEFPGKFLLGYLPRVKPRVELVTVTPDGFRYRGRVHATLNGLFRWFKEHFRDPIPGLLQDYSLLLGLPRNSGRTVGFISGIIDCIIHLTKVLTSLVMALIWWIQKI